MKATILLRNLSFKAYIGCELYEQKRKQKVFCDIELKTDISDALKSDDINDALDYREHIEKIENYLKDSRHALIETLSHKIADIFLAHPRVEHITLTLKKPSAIKQAEWVGINIEKSKKDVY